MFDVRVIANKLRGFLCSHGFRRQVSSHTCAQFDDPPIFSEEEKEECRISGDPMPIIFEAYKYVTKTIVTIAAIDIIGSSGCYQRQNLHSAVTFGLANRCARLMCSSVELTQNARNREAFSVLQRSMLESAIKLMWICQDDHENRIKNYLADGLCADLEFEDLIRNEITQNDNISSLNETQLLRSIQFSLDTSKLTREFIRPGGKRKQRPCHLPNMHNIMNQLGFDRIAYVVQQRIGSHAVHGTWSDLLDNYIDYNSETDTFIPRFDQNVPRAGQYVGIALFILNAFSAYSQFIFTNANASNAMLEIHNWLFDLSNELSVH